MSSVASHAGIRASDAGDGVRLITLSRPPVNALDWGMKRALVDVLAETRNDATIRALVVASDHPKAFCAGSDLHELAQDHADPGSAVSRTTFEFSMWQALSELPQPSVAAVEGYALGSGLELCVACDFRIAGSDARFGLPEVRIGGAPGIQTLTRLPSIVGLGAARRMLLLGDSLTADEAHHLGLVDLVTPAGDALDVALSLARRLADEAASSIRFLKSVLEASVADSMDRVRPLVLGNVEALFQAPEMREGIQAFRDKRAPDFRAIASVSTEPSR